jgi:anti-sigma-K factor RskA
VFHLRCPSGSGPGATANANVYVSADRKQWELEIQGLASQPPEREYQIWFMVGGETRNGGCFTMQDGEVALLNPASFPPGPTGIAISLEPKGGSMRPTSPPILVSTEPVRL